MTMHMKILDLVIGSEIWKSTRTQYKVASEAPAMMGADPNFTRSDLLRLKSTGIEREISEWTEKFIFKRGHETEAKARPITEALIGDKLYPICGVREVDGLMLLATFDGITAPIYDLHWEHKQFNKELFAIVQAEGELPPKIYWQLEHQLLVNGNDSCIFSCSDGTEKNYAQMEYVSRPNRRAELIAGWKLFDRDLEAYVHEADLPVIVGEVIPALPPLDVEVLSEVKHSNLTLYKANITDYLSRINEDLQTDHDFATAKNIVKFLKERESEISLIEKKILEGSTTTGETMRTLQHVFESVRTKRLTLDRLVVEQDKTRRAEALTAGKTEWAQYRLEVESSIKPYRLPHIEETFVTAVRNKRTLATYREAVKNEVARLKIAADVWKQNITENIVATEFTEEYRFLFNDMQELIVKEKEALVAIAQQRITNYKAEQDKKVKEAAAALVAKQAEQEQAAQEQAAQATPKKAPVQMEPPVSPIRGSVVGTRLGTQTAAPVYNTAYSEDYLDLAPAAYEIVTAVAVAFSVDNETALEWIAKMNVNEARTALAQAARKGARVS